MNTSVGWRQRRVLEARSRAGTPCTAIDHAKVGRSLIRRRARGITPSGAAAALEKVRRPRTPSRSSPLTGQRRKPSSGGSEGNPQPVPVNSGSSPEPAEGRSRPRCRQPVRDEDST